MVTGDSMRARGYGSGRRTSFQIYTMKRGDWCLLAVLMFLAAAVIAVSAMGPTAAEFTPVLSIAPVSGIYALGFAAYCAYLLIPSVLHLKEELQWRRSRSKI